ncbi:peptidyl-prolyl cis-trans isomerase FKBP16-3, chloroplastic isoform X1 [Diospyros lotus]|uniref:peptidyl-prolyl cis-trans isomerase FKBP16-3, chloroplastic isoform X1 n=1 Tax=Diospyros lotus TaxID=55363 RepID=UPI00224E5CE0|nr:peptidyl-prolyl cis-trans isomerase FKBP16-3, chloroplastic isoform X1 [Diospyros lotus]
MASSSLLLPLVGSTFSKCFATNNHILCGNKIGAIVPQCRGSEPKARAPKIPKYADLTFIKRRDAIGLGFGVSSLFINLFDAEGAGLPPEEKPRLCDDTCEKELENVPMVTTESGLQYKDIKVGQGPTPPVGFQVAANYVAMVPSGQIFDSSLEKGLPYLFRVGSGQVIKGLDEGILGMKIGGKRRLYIPGPLAFPKGLTSAPGRPRVPPSSPVIFDVSLEYIPGLESDEE